MNTIKVELSIEEANSLLSVLDVAVKAGGMRVAPAALLISQRIEDAAKKEIQKQEVA